MRIRYCIVTLNQLQWITDRHLPSVDFSLVDGLHIHVSEIEHQMYNKVSVTDPMNIPEFANKVGESSDWRITTSVHNLGVSHAWNQFIKMARSDGYDAVIIANDDIFLYDGALQRFVEKMRESSFVYFNGMNAFCFFGIHLDYADKIGEFDIHFWPAYFEDNDYHRRMKYHGYQGDGIDGPSFFHAGSATLGIFEAQRKLMHLHNFNKNRRYYIVKWGGLPGYELYDTPFNRSEGVNNAESGLDQTVINGIEQTPENL